MPRRSPLCTKDCPRACLDLVIPPEVADLDILLGMRHYRAQGLLNHAYYGFRSMVGHTDALILEGVSPTATPHYWEHCTQLVAISPQKCVVITAVDQSTWTATMDNVLRIDTEETSVLENVSQCWGSFCYTNGHSKSSRRIPAERSTTCIQPGFPRRCSYQGRSG